MYGTPQPGQAPDENRPAQQPSPPQGPPNWQGSQPWQAPPAWQGTMVASTPPSRPHGFWTGFIVGCGVMLVLALGVAGLMQATAQSQAPGPSLVSGVNTDDNAVSTDDNIPLPTLADCAIQLRYNDVTVVLRDSSAAACARAESLLSYLGTWYTIDAGTATQHKRLTCTGTYAGVAGTVEVWDTGGEINGTEICREWNLPTQ
jgi:hypothetical protein